ncbi:hypothetical protein PUR33_00510, partial [Streptomyces sp. BE282]|nr:hypothetical protein [Streptomyces sp. BE282]
ETLPQLTRAVRAAHPGLELGLTGPTCANTALSRGADRSLHHRLVRQPVSPPRVAHPVIAHEDLGRAPPVGGGAGALGLGGGDAGGEPGDGTVDQAALLDVLDRGD